MKGSIPYDDLHAKIAKTGKQVRHESSKVCVWGLISAARSSLARRLNERLSPAMNQGMMLRERGRI